MSVEIIAEAGINHGGHLKVALEMVDAALGAGCHAVKFQTYDPNKLMRQSDPLFRVLSELSLPRLHFITLAKHCKSCGIEFMSTPGDLDSLKFLVEELGVKRIKIGSDDLTYYPLTIAAGATGLPLLLSTGMATMKEVVSATRYVGHDLVTLLHCVSLYPTPIDEANLRAITTLERLGYPVGYSDHCTGIQACLTAVALGATVIEKHFMLEKYASIAADVDVSITERDLLDLSNRVYDVSVMLGSGIKEPCEAEKANIPRFRKGADGFRGQ